MTHPAHRLRRLLVLTAVSLVVSALSAPAAGASTLVDSVTEADCDSQVMEKPFTPWLDNFDYTLVPGGDFEKARRSAWNLANSSIVAGNETHYVRSPKDSRSLSLGAAGTGQSPAMCATIYHPTLRFFARNTGNPTSTLTVDVLFEDATGAIRTASIGSVAATGEWQPTAPMAVVANLVAAYSGERTAVAFRFQASGLGGDWQIDDVFVDPYRRS